MSYAPTSVLHSTPRRNALPLAQAEEADLRARQERLDMDEQDFSAKSEKLEGIMAQFKGLG